LDAVAGVFPTYGEADWREAAAAALKSASLDALVSMTADGIRIEPLYQPVEGGRALRTNGPWRIIARLDHPDAGQANAQALDDLANGADGLQVVFSGALGAYGFGLKRFDPATLHKAFEGARFDADPRFELDLGPNGAEQAKSFASLIERSGALPADCAVSFGLDPFAACAYAAFPSDWAARARPYVDTALALGARGFGGPLVVADARVQRRDDVRLAVDDEAEVTEERLVEDRVDRLAVVAAALGLAKARALIAFRLAADADEFVTLSKFRALRLAWARIQEACGLEPRAAHVQAESAWRMMTARDPYVNVMRGAIAAFSAGLGGADSVSVLPHTLAVGLPDGLARRLARNGQLILLRESNLGLVADPADGAGAFDALSKALCRKGWAIFQEIERQGGLPAALASGAFQRQVAESAAALKRDVARLKSPITGVSAHARDALPAAEGALAQLRLAQPFEALRDTSDAILRQAGSRPKVYLAALGPERSHRRRVAFAREMLEAGGVESVYDGEAATPEQAVKRLTASGTSFACLCGADETYSARAEAFAEAIKASGAKRLILTGRPGKAEAALRGAGVDDFIFAGGDVLAALQGIYLRVAA